MEETKKVFLVFYRDKNEESIECYGTLNGAEEAALEIVQENRDLWKIPEEISDHEAFENWFELTGDREDLYIEEKTVY